MQNQTTKRRGLFAALDAADKHLREVEWLRDTAMFAPPVGVTAMCPCGANLEIRSDAINLTSTELAELSGTLDPREVERVISTINHIRSRANSDALGRFLDDHSYCEDQS